ncbi:hypothetical protein AOC36_08480 [Erysipelothrix larvae]|uniref:Glycosyltransferase 2-like domain-containing protein n=1 Tax=Erysipelothrix larvae TaxID=1514105 RepID=A0A120JTV4_9FIRM|nr:hypothetical protein [Erysipelothrix larvae]AMC94020.1 hypothetical protein AOC36_08480 [Erysipelothrix larvae]
MTNQLKNYQDLSVLINSCDAYQDLWEPFQILFNKFGGMTFENVSLNSESGGSIKPNIKGIQTGHGSYGNRMIKALTRIDREFVLILLDDFFIREAIDHRMLDQLIGLMKEDPSIACISFDDNLQFGRVYNEAMHLNVTAQYAPYKLNLQAGLWRTQDFLSFWDDADNPWLWELFGNIKAVQSKKTFLYISDLNYAPIKYGKNSGGWAVYRGKWVEEDVVPLFKTHEIEIDFSKRGFFTEDDMQSLGIPMKLKIKYIYKKLGVGVLLRYFQFLVSKTILKRTYSSFEEFLERKGK